MYFVRICRCVEKRGKNRGNTLLSRREEVQRRTVCFSVHMCPGGAFFLQKVGGLDTGVFLFFFPFV
jgi:hypothetical protein